MKVIYKEIAAYINKTEENIKYLKKTNPQLVEILKLGSFCKKYNISVEDLKKIIIKNKKYV
jgi:hypothetical protein